MMDRAQEFAFAWALLDARPAFLSEADRVQLCIRIGAGEYRESIIDLLQRFTGSDTPLPPVLAASLWAWMAGFVGSDFETPLRDLASRIQVSNVGSLPVSAVDIPPVSLVPRRSEQAARRLATAK